MRLERDNSIPCDSRETTAFHATRERQHHSISDLLPLLPAQVVLPNDPELVDVLAKNGVDISVSEGDQQGNYVSLLGNLLFPLIAFAGLFFLFRRAQDGQGGAGGPMGGMGGGMGGAMDFGKSRTKFQEIPDTGVMFADVAGCDSAKLELVEIVDFLK